MKKETDVTWIVSIVMILIFVSPFIYVRHDRIRELENELKETRIEMECWRNICHDYWQYCDPKHTFFDDVIVEGDDFSYLDSLYQGDFEDFFYSW